MPFSGNTFTLPSGNPVVTGTTVSSVWANATLTDIASGLTATTTQAALAASTGSSLVGHIASGTGAAARTVQAKLRDIVNICDFGASTSASAANNSTAITAAIATGKDVWIPDGTFNVASGFTLSTISQKIRFASRNAKLVCATDFTLFTVAAAWVDIDHGDLQGAASDTTSTTAGILITNCVRGRFSFNYVHGFGYGIQMYGATSNWANDIYSPYLYQNTRAGIYGCGHGTNIVGGEIAGSVFLVLQAALQAGTALKIDRDATSEIGSAVSLFGTKLESAGTATYAVSAAADNGSGLVRLTIATHPFSTGDFISVTGITGTTEANGVWPVTVVDSTHIDLKTSAFANAWVSGGTCRRGVGLYWGVNQSGPHTEGLYVEDVPVLAHLGDAFKNDGTSAHSAVVEGGKINCRNVTNAAVQSCLVAAGRPRNTEIVGNYSTGTQQTLINSRGANTSFNLTKHSNQGFTREYEATGTQAMGGLILKPVTRNGDRVLEVQIPDTSGSSTLSPVLILAQHLAASWTAQTYGVWEFNNDVHFYGNSTFLVPAYLKSYVKSSLPSAATAGGMIYVSDEVGGAVPAFSDGTNWRRVTDRAIVT